LMNIFFLYKGLSTIIIIIEFQKKENNWLWKSLIITSTNTGFYW
jgi:hypothetical protein